MDQAWTHRVSSPDTTRIHVGPSLDPAWIHPAWIQIGSSFDPDCIQPGSAACYAPMSEHLHLARKRTVFGEISKTRGMHACIIMPPMATDNETDESTVLGFWLRHKSPQVVKQVSSSNTNNGLGMSKKGSRHNPPLPECRATPRACLAAL